MSHQYLALLSCNQCIGRITGGPLAFRREGGRPMRASDTLSFDPVRYGAYICLSIPAAGQAAAAGADVPALADRLGLCNEYGSAGADPAQSIAYLRRVSAVPGQVAEAGLLGAEAIVHVAATAPEAVAEFRAELG